MSAYAIFSALYLPHLGGIENFTQGLAQALITRGHKVIVVTSQLRDQEAGWSIEEGIEVLRLPSFDVLGGRLPLPRFTKQRRALLADLDQRSLDGVLVNARFYPHSITGCACARRHGLRPVVLDHGSYWLSFGNSLLDVAAHAHERLMTAWGRRYNPAYYGISEKSAAWLQTFGIDAQGAIHNALDAQGYVDQASQRAFRAELAIDQDSLLVAFVGRLVPEKGIRALIEVSNDQEVRSHDIHFVVAGDGPLAGEVKEAQSKHFHWVGRLSRSDTAALFMQANMLCLPTRSEGFSTTLLEAGACGCAALVTDVGGARELNPNNNCDLIIPHARLAAVKKGCLWAESHREQLAEQGISARNQVLKLFSWSATAKAFEQAARDVKQASEKGRL